MRASMVNDRNGGAKPSALGPQADINLATALCLPGGETDITKERARLPRSFIQAWLHVVGFLSGRLLRCAQKTQSHLTFLQDGA
jgi:hypothetical protein